MRISLAYIFLILLLSCNKTKTDDQAGTDTESTENPEENNSSSSKRKTMDMTFVSYEEGDYPHLLFKEIATGEEFDFRHIDENKLGGFPLLLEDENASFGFKANPKYLKKAFEIEAIYKKVSDNDLNGENIETEAWVINDIEELKSDEEMDSKSVKKEEEKEIVSEDTNAPAGASIGVVNTKEGTDLMLRLNPNLDAGIITKIPNKSKVRVVGYGDKTEVVNGEKGKWYKVYYGGRTGWAWGNFITIEK